MIDSTHFVNDEVNLATQSGLLVYEITKQLNTVAFLVKLIHDPLKHFHPRVNQRVLKMATENL